MIREGNHISSDNIYGSCNNFSCRKKKVALVNGAFRIILIVSIKDDILVLNSIYAKSDKIDLNTQEYNKVRSSFDSFCADLGLFIAQETEKYELCKE